MPSDKGVGVDNIGGIVQGGDVVDSRICSTTGPKSSRRIKTIKYLNQVQSLTSRVGIYWYKVEGLKYRALIGRWEFTLDKF